MKKIIIALFGRAVAGSSFAAATQVCSGTGGNGTLIAGNAANFVRIDVLPKCSNNVLLKYDQTANGFAAAGSSSKGKQIFTGNTGGGSVGSAGVCANSVCHAGQLDTPLQTALDAAT